MQNDDIVLKNIIDLILEPNTEISVWSIDRDGGEEEIYFGTAQNAKR